MTLKSVLGLAVLWHNPLIKEAHVGKEKHFTPASLGWAELARLLLVVCSGPGRARPEGYQWHPRPGMACALSRMPPPGPNACWPMLRTLPSVLPPVGKLANEPSPDSGVRPGGWRRRRRRVAVVWRGMLPGVSESHSITLFSWALLRRAAGTSRSHLGRSGAWQGAAGRVQLLFKLWQKSSISVSQQEMQGAPQSRT